MSSDRDLRFCHAQNPSRIDLLELDIDLRLADLWREAYEIGEWKLDVVAAFIRAAYGKGSATRSPRSGREPVPGAWLPRACAAAADGSGLELAPQVAFRGFLAVLR